MLYIGFNTVMTPLNVTFTKKKIDKANLDNKFAPNFHLRLTMSPMEPNNGATGAEGILDSRILSKLKKEGRDGCIAFFPPKITDKIKEARSLASKKPQKTVTLTFFFKYFWYSSPFFFW